MIVTDSQIVILFNLKCVYFARFSFLIPIFNYAFQRIFFDILPLYHFLTKFIKGLPPSLSRLQVSNRQYSTQAKRLHCHIKSPNKQNHCFLPDNLIKFTQYSNYLWYFQKAKIKYTGPCVHEKIYSEFSCCVINAFLFQMAYKGM